MRNGKPSIIIATIKSWNIKNALEFKRREKKFNVFLLTDKQELVQEKIKKIKPRYIFFPHWSWKIPENIYQNYECVVFHETDLPFGRGGSPIQNLIVRKMYQTKITALRVNGTFDGGDIYLKCPLSLKNGSVGEMLKRSSKIIFSKMIPYILEHRPVAAPQKGKVVIFKRRGHEESDLAKVQLISQHAAYDFIRMLDGEGYPPAFLKLGRAKICFSKAKIKSGKLVGQFEMIYEK